MSHQGSSARHRDSIRSVRASPATWAGAFFLFILFTAAATAQTEMQQQRFGDDIYASGGEVAAPADSRGDAFVAGGRIALTGAVGGDALVAGGSVNIDASVGEDLYAAGGEVNIANKVGGNARLAGGRVTLAPNAAVEGSVTIAGGSVTLDGNVGGYALVSAGGTQVNGRIAGDLRVVGGSLRVGPDAVIQGRLEYRGAQPANIAPGAQILGGIEQTSTDRDYSVSFGMLAVWLLGLIVAVAVLLTLAPRATRAAAQTLRARPIASPLLGLALFIGLPILGGLLALTVLGLPIGLFAFAAWLVLILLGYFVSAVVLGSAWAERSGPATRGKHILAAVVALIILFILGQLPYVGWLVWSLALVFGIGAIALAIIEALQLRPAATR